MQWSLSPQANYFWTSQVEAIKIVLNSLNIFFAFSTIILPEPDYNNPCETKKQDLFTCYLHGWGYEDCDLNLIHLDQAHPVRLLPNCSACTTI